MDNKKSMIMLKRFGVFLILFFYVFMITKAEVKYYVDINKDYQTSKGEEATYIRYHDVPEIYVDIARKVELIIHVKGVDESSNEVYFNEKKLTFNLKKGEEKNNYNITTSWLESGYNVVKIKSKKDNIEPYRSELRIQYEEFTISGTVTDGLNKPIEGVTISFSHDGHTEVTGNDGKYSYSVIYGINTWIIPSNPEYYNWNPAIIQIDRISKNILEQDFTGTLIGPPTVTTDVISEVLSSSAKGGGDVTADGSEPVTARGVCWHIAPTPDLNNSFTFDGTGTGSFTSQLTGLKAGTKYYVRAYATNSIDTSFGNEVTFTTDATSPSVTTLPISNVTSVSAMGGGNVNSDGGKPIKARGVCWSTSFPPTTANDYTVDGSGKGGFNSFISGLKPLTTYYVSAYASNIKGLNYGSIVEFTTTNTPDRPVVITQAVTGIRIGSAVCGGVVMDEGNSPVTSRGVAWATSPNHPTPSYHTSDNTGIGPFSSLLTGLKEGETYYVRAYAINSYGTSFGEELSFVPTATTPTVTTASATFTSETTASGGGNVSDDGGTEITERGICWSTSASPTITDNVKKTSPGTGSFSCSITGLTPGVTYYVRAFAVNEKGTAYGGDVTLSATTPPAPSNIDISRDRMNFTVMLKNGQVDTFTGSQQLFVFNTGGGVLDWSGITSDDWISLDPSVKQGDAMVSVSINPEGMTLGNSSGNIRFSTPGQPPKTIYIYLSVKDGSTDQAPEGSLDTPLEGARVSGSIPVTGWAIDDVGVTGVKIFRDPVSGEDPGWKYIGDAIFVEGARPDVERQYTGKPNNSSAGWGYMLLTHFLPGGGNGTYTLHAEATDSAGNRTLLGSRTIICDNANAIKPFGAIDTPAQGGVADGNANDKYVNWGWALTPPPNYIPSDGSTISVWVDGISRGNPVYGVFREDIARLFPGYFNSNGALGYFYLDTSAFATGVHTIAWSVRDSAGNTDGVGSRYFINIRPASATSASTAFSTNAIRRYFPPPATPASLSARPSLTSPTLSISTGWQHKSIPGQGKEGKAFEIETRPLEPIVISPPPGTRYTAAWSLVNGKYRPLPIGAVLDMINGSFHWLPGPGFHGKFTIVLTGTDANNKAVIDTVLIKIK